MFDTLKKVGLRAIAAVERQVSQIANQDDFNAVIAACVLVSLADGKASEAEEKALLNAVRSLPDLQAFSVKQVNERVTEYYLLVVKSAVFGQEKLFERVGKCKGTVAAETVLRAALSVAKTESGVDAAEKTALLKIATELGFSAAQAEQVLGF